MKKFAEDISLLPIEETALGLPPDGATVDEPRVARIR
jgi:hypothetical protein